MDFELEDLQYHWGSAYMIAHPAPDLWVAQRRDDGQQLTAVEPLELLLAIREDYHQKPVPRRGTTSGPVPRRARPVRPIGLAPDAS